jgi:hypothetical protein
MLALSRNACAQGRQGAKGANRPFVFRTTLALPTMQTYGGRPDKQYQHPKKNNQHTTERTQVSDSQWWVCKKRVRKLLKNELKGKAITGRKGLVLYVTRAGANPESRNVGRKVRKEGRAAPFPTPAVNGFRSARPPRSGSAPRPFRSGSGLVWFRSGSGSGPARGPLWFRFRPAQEARPHPIAGVSIPDPVTGRLAVPCGGHQAGPDPTGSIWFRFGAGPWRGGRGAAPFDL